MNKFLMYVLLFSCLAFAENETRVVGELINKDSIFTAAEDSALVDTVNIGAIVQGQIEAAKQGIMKSSIFMPVNNKQSKVEVKKVAEKKKAGFFEGIIQDLNELNKNYANLIIFVFGSLLILGFVVGRRLIKVSAGSKKKMKKAINIIRDEKPVSIQNKKLNEMRKKLSESEGIYDISEETVSGKAKNLKVGKGELILAAKIKAFQLSKVFK